MVAWTLVPPLVELTDQMNERFPKREKKSDGSIGNQIHAQGTSSHNPDKTGKPEWRDGDNKNEVRAKDLDKDLNDPNCSMEQVVQEWVRLARAGKLWWVRYIIFNGRIWHRKDGFKTRVYKGKNKHDKHAHVTSEFTQKADEAKGVDWGLKNFRKPKPPSTKPPKPPTPSSPTKPAPLEVDGVLGTKTIQRWQELMKNPTGSTGAWSSNWVKHLQTFLKRRVNDRLVVDGRWGANSIRALQQYLKAPVDGVISEPKSKTVIALQRRLNEGRF